MTRAAPNPAGEISTRALLALAIPSVASALLNHAYRAVDLYAVQWLGMAAQAALGSATFVLIATNALVILISAGAAPLVARATGSGDTTLRRQVVGNALLASVTVGVVVSIFFAVGADSIASWLGLQGEPAAMLATYLRTLAVGGVVFALGPLVDACFFSMGNARLPLTLQILFTIANAALNALFIYKLGMGIAGAAWASVVARAATAALGVAALWWSVRWSWADMWPSEALRRVLRVGYPIAANLGAYALVYWVLLAAVISPLGPEVNAALGVGFSALEGLAWPLFHGFEIAIASLVGRQLGAGRIDGAEAASRLALPWTLGTGTAMAMLFYVAAEPLCAFFVEDPRVLSEAVVYARVLAFSQLFVAIEAHTEGVLAGAGDTRSVFWWSVPMNIARVPLGWALAFPVGWGAAGVWWAINLTTYAKAAGKTAAVVWGRWKTLEI